MKECVAIGRSVRRMAAGCVQTLLTGTARRVRRRAHLRCKAQPGAAAQPLSRRTAVRGQRALAAHLQTPLSSARTFGAKHSRGLPPDRSDAVFIFLHPIHALAAIQNCRLPVGGGHNSGQASNRKPNHVQHTVNNGTGNRSVAGPAHCTTPITRRTTTHRNAGQRLIRGAGCRSSEVAAGRAAADGS